MGLSTSTHWHKLQFMTCCTCISHMLTSSSRSLLRKFLSSQWYSYISGGPTDFSVASSNSILDILANSPTFSCRDKPTTSTERRETARHDVLEVIFMTCSNFDELLRIKIRSKTKLCPPHPHAVTLLKYRMFKKKKLN